MRNYTTWCSLCLIFAPTFTHSQDLLLFESVDENQKNADGSPIMGMVYEKQIGLNPEVVAANPDTLVFTLDTGLQYRALRRNFQRYDDEWVAWSGNVQELDGSDGYVGYLFLNFFQGRVSAVIRARGENYNIVPGVAGSHRLIRMKDTVFTAGTTQCELEAPSQKRTIDIDVMALYTRDFLEDATKEQEAKDFISTGFTIANAILANHNLNFRYRSVYIGPNPTAEPMLPEDASTTTASCDEPVIVALEHLNKETPEITNLRQAYGADIVALFISPRPDGANDQCGVANLPLKGQDTEEVSICSSSGDFNKRAFLAAIVNCGQNDFTFAHEMGHNLAMYHHITSPEPPDNLIYSYGIGYVFERGSENKVATVMGCNLISENNPEGVCNRIPFFSDPDIKCVNLDPGCSDPESNCAKIPAGTTEADNARVAEMRGPLVAEYMPTISNEKPTLDITSPSEGTEVEVGTPITFAATAQDLEDENLDHAIEWFLDIETPDGFGPTFTIPFSVDGTHVITAMVTDSGGKRVEQSIRVQVTGPPILRVKQGGTTFANGEQFEFPSRSVDNLPLIKSFILFNDGAGDLTITNPGNLVNGVGFRRAGPLNAQIKGGEYTPLFIEFKPTNPGMYSGALTIESNDETNSPFILDLRATALESAVQLEASYVSGLGQPRTTFGSSSNDPPEFDYYYDPNLGNFEQRPGGACPNPNGAENPTYLKISLGGSILNQGGIDDCSFGASWDNGQVFPCNGVQIAALNSGQETVIGTDDYNINPGTCEEYDPRQPHVAYNQSHWFLVNFVVDGTTYPRKIKFRRTSQVLEFDPLADTYVSQLAPTWNFGSFPTAQVRSSSTGDGKFALMRFQVNESQLGGVRGSARVHWKVMSYPIGYLDFHRVCNGNWAESQLTWNNWGQLTGGSCGIIETRTNLPANKTAVFDAGIQPFSSVVTFGAATLDTGFGRSFRTREAPNVTDRPKLVVTVQKN